MMNKIKQFFSGLTWKKVAGGYLVFIGALFMLALFGILFYSIYMLAVLLEMKLWPMIGTFLFIGSIALAAYLVND